MLTFGCALVENEYESGAKKKGWPVGHPLYSEDEF